MPKLTIVKSDKLLEHEDIPPLVRQGADAVKARAESIRRTLGAPCAIPGNIERAKEDLALLAMEALQLRGML